MYDLIGFLALKEIVQCLSHLTQCCVDQFHNVFSIAVEIASACDILSQALLIL